MSLSSPIPLTTATTHLSVTSFLQSQQFLDLLERELPEQLSCPICFLPMADAWIVACCGQSLCKECLAKMGQCSFCRQNIDAARCCPNRTANDLFQDLKVNACPWGCEKSTLKVSELFSHFTHCAKTLVPCPHAVLGCNFAGSREQLKCHALSCPARLVRSIVRGLEMKVESLEAQVRFLQDRLNNAPPAASTSSRDAATLQATPVREAVHIEQPSTPNDHQRPRSVVRLQPEAVPTPHLQAALDIAAQRDSSLCDRIFEAEFVVEAGTPSDNLCAEYVRQADLYLISKTSSHPVRNGNGSTQHYDSVPLNRALHQGTYFLRYRITALPHGHDICLGFAAHPRYVDLAQGHHAWNRHGGFIISSREHCAWTARAPTPGGTRHPMVVDEIIVACIDIPPAGSHRRASISFVANGRDLGVAFQYDPEELGPMFPVIELYMPCEAVEFHGLFELVTDGHRQ